MNTHTVEFIQGLLLAFACVVILMPPYLRLLRWIGIGKQIREDGPGTHLVKQGTPTMGGVLIVVVVGEEAAGIVAGASSLGEAVVGVPDREAALAALRERLKPGDTVLVKASRGVALEWIVESLVGSVRSPFAGSVAAEGSRRSGESSEEIR